MRLNERGRQKLGTFCRYNYKPCTVSRHSMQTYLLTYYNRLWKREPSKVLYCNFCIHIGRFEHSACGSGLKLLMGRLPFTTRAVSRRALLWYATLPYSRMGSSSQTECQTKIRESLNQQRPRSHGSWSTSHQCKHQTLLYVRAELAVLVQVNLLPASWMKYTHGYPPRV